MLIEHQHPLNKSITIGLFGLPNVGKSTFVNEMLGFDLSVVTKLPQTTRNSIQCVTCVDRTEIIFLDTPGIHNSNQEINKRMVGQATERIADFDLNFFLFDLSRNLHEQWESMKSFIGDYHQMTWVIFNKADLVDEGIKEEAKQFFTQLHESNKSFQQYFILSAQKGEGTKELKKSILKVAPSAPHLYPDGEASNKNERFFAAEYIREQAFKYLKEELPYEITVLIEEYKDFREGKEKRAIDTHISASILVNRPSQKGIVVGSKGEMIKKIGMGAREKIEAMLEGRVHLNLHVKVSPKWFNNNFVLEEIGLKRAQNSGRLWRKK